VALDRDSQGSRIALGQARHIPARLRHLGQNTRARASNRWPMAVKRKGRTFFFDQRSPIVAFQRFELVRQGRLGQK